MPAGYCGVGRRPHAKQPAKAIAEPYARPRSTTRDVYGRAGRRCSSRATRPSAPGDPFAPPESPQSQRPRDAAVFSNAPEMDGDQESGGKRQPDDVEHVEPQQRVRSELESA